MVDSTKLKALSQHLARDFNANEMAVLDRYVAGLVASEAHKYDDATTIIGYAAQFVAPTFPGRCRCPGAP